MSETKMGIIQEQGDYNIFHTLNSQDQKLVKNDQRVVNESKKINVKDQIRLGDCAHLDKKR